MTTISYQKTLCVLIALIAVNASGLAQETNPNANSTVAGPAPGCSGPTCPEPQIAIATMGGPPLEQQVGVVSTGGMAFTIHENAEVVKNQPYQAQAVTEMKQTLADGSHITQTTTAAVARDTDGRTVRVQKLSTVGPWKSASDSSQASGPTLTSIFDPVAKTHTDYTSDNNVAHVLTMPSPPASGTVRGGPGGFAVFASGAAGGGEGPLTMSVRDLPEAHQPAGEPDAKTESLGTKTIEGISVTGTKVTSTIRAGTIGNDKDLVITHETWYSPDLKLVIQSTQSDPRFGETTFSLTNIQRSEPDPSMFQLPDGYTVDKVPVKFQPR